MPTLKGLRQKFNSIRKNPPCVGGFFAARLFLAQRRSLFYHAFLRIKNALRHACHKAFLLFFFRCKKQVVASAKHFGLFAGIKVIAQILLVA